MDNKINNLTKNNSLPYFLLNKSISFLFNIYLSIIKIIIISLLISLSLYFFYNLIKKDLSVTRTDEAKIFLLSFVQNPEGLKKISEYYEKKGDFKKAIISMELAIGLMELHNANIAYLSSYKKRLNKLQVLMVENQIKK
jgi:hypothetical protein